MASFDGKILAPQGLLPAGWRVASGDLEESLDILREAAAWLSSIGRPQWAPEELTAGSLGCRPQDCLALYSSGGVGAATLCLTDADPFYWPEIPPGQCGYLHKLAVRREFAGQGIAALFVRYAAELCRARGLSALCLDCDPSRAGVVRFYDSLGFQLYRIERFQRPWTGELELALYRLALNP